MSPLSEARAANAAFAPAYLPVALFVGGTAGIGRAAAAAFARHTHGRAHIIIAGRSRAAGEAALASFPRAPESRYEFVQCDVSLIANVRATASALRSSLPKLNFLVVSTGLMTLKGRDETAEGLDRKMVLDYYARWALVRELMPLLRAAKDAGEDAKVLSVLAAGQGGPIDLANLDLKTGYSLPRVMEAAATYNDIMIESFAEQQPDMAFTHVFPGLVRTDLTRPAHWALAPLWLLMQAAMYPLSIAPEESAEYVLHALLAGERGAFRRGDRAQLLENAGKSYHVTEEAKAKLWAHTVAATTAA
ncbi:hypothetical protein HWV62_13563 [Athelia sp. TMB]|nr:hypothetical protein HWV62_13563 [Athelia sp. TMB]